MIDNSDVKLCQWFLEMCKIKILAYVAFGPCTSTGSRVCKPCNTLSVINVCMYYNLIDFILVCKTSFIQNGAG